VKGGGDDQKIYLGNEVLCRFCGSSDPTQFRTAAHTIPEALGNKWIFSRDECDNCNSKFGAYDDALANSISPFLTLGGTKGKENKVRQTGRTTRNFVRHQSADQGRQLSIYLRDAEPHSLIKVTSDGLYFRIPIAAVPFRARHGYKALTKIGFALLPDDELRHFEKLRAWLSKITIPKNFPVWM
jgi:hypothetical protein